MTTDHREHFIDRIRVVLTALVIFHHTAITYGASGGWFYRELPEAGTVSSLLLTFFCTINQAYFMGLFFFISGYYTPRSLDKKGYRKFILDRLLRLGVPLLFFALVLGPLTIWMAQDQSPSSLRDVLWKLWEKRVFVSGPLWFSLALLLFSFGYCALKSLRHPVGNPPRPFPSYRYGLVSAFVVGLGAFVARQFFPIGEDFLGLQLGYFSSYVFLFAVGGVARKNDWLSQLTWDRVRPWVLTSLWVCPWMPIAIVAARVYQAPIGDFLGGLTFSTILYAFWEPFFAWGMIAGILFWFQRIEYRPSQAWRFLARGAYLVFIIHPLILIGISSVLRPWQTAAVLKFAVVGGISCLACWVIAGALVKVPGIREIV